MSIVSPFWMFAWFIVGLITFQEPRAKGILAAVSSIFTILGLLSYSPSQTLQIVQYIGLSKISGLLTMPIYLFSANISRFAQFGKLSPRVIIYGAIIVLILILI